MKKKLLIIRNISREGAGLLEDILTDRGIEFIETDLSKGEKLPSLEKVNAVIILGGPDSANDKNQKMAAELIFIQDVLEKKIPYLGICLGLQTLVKAAGGEVVESHIKEVGFRDGNGSMYSVELTEEGLDDPLFKGLEKSVNVFQLHGETVILTEKMKLLATGKQCRNQIVKIGSNAYGIQCHFELNRELLDLWMMEDQDLRKADTDSILFDFKSIREQYTQIGNRLFLNFLNIASLI